MGLRVTDTGNLSGTAATSVQVATNPLLGGGTEGRSPAPRARLSRDLAQPAARPARGIAVRLRCSEACVMGAAGTIQRSTSRRYRIFGGRAQPEQGEPRA